MQRVLVIGCAGSGKSILSGLLADRLELPLISLDACYWKPGWVEPARSEWRERIAALVAEPRWIMDGNYSGTFDLRMPRADTVVWLDMRRGTCLRRVLLRTVIGYGRTRPGLTAGCPERFDLSFLRYVWRFPRQSRPHIVEQLAKHGKHLRVVRLADDRSVTRFLAAPGAA